MEHETDTDVKNAIEQVMKAVKQKEQAFKDFHKMEAMPAELTAFDDIFMPAQGGQSPVSIEGIPGQSSNIDTSYLDDIRRMIINSTKVPPSLLGDTENSYHTTASQENHKFARTIIRYQHQFQTQLTNAINKIYYEIHGKELNFNKIVFNAPAFSRVEQVATMIGQADVICNFIVDSYGIGPNQQPNLPKKLVAKEYAKFIDWDKIEEIYQDFLLKQKKDIELSKVQNPDGNLDIEAEQNIQQ